QLQVREVDELVGAAEVRVEAVDLVQHLLRLGTLGRDRGGRTRVRGDADETRRKRSDEHVRRRTPSQALEGPERSDVVDAPVGPVQHEWRRLATCEDGGNRRVHPDGIWSNLPSLGWETSIGAVVRSRGV